MRFFYTYILRLTTTLDDVGNENSQE
jgi:hypothetical protein